MEHPLTRSQCNLESGLEFVLGRTNYVLGGSLGDGAVGLVWRAMTVTDNKTRAIKFLAPDPKYIEESVMM